MTFDEAKDPQEITSNQGNTFYVVNPTHHKTSRQGIQPYSNFNQPYSKLMQPYSILIKPYSLGLRSAIVFSPQDYTIFMKMVHLCRKRAKEGCEAALVNFGGEALTANVCHKLWIDAFLQAGESCPSYPKRIGYGLLRAQVI